MAERGVWGRAFRFSCELCSANACDRGEARACVNVPAENCGGIAHFVRAQGKLRGYMVDFRSFFAPIPPHFLVGHPIFPRTFAVGESEGLVSRASKGKFVPYATYTGPT